MANAAEACGSCALFVFLVAIVAGAITQIVFDIIALKQTSNNEVTDECPSSALWSFVLVSLILNCLSLIFQSGSSKKEETQNKQGITINVITVNVAVCVWGCIELWGVECVSEVDDTLLYTMAMVHVISSIVSLGIVVLCIVGACCSVVCK